MANMSYCRFQNTVADLRDCYDALSEQEPAELSQDEQAALWRMVRLCRKIVDDYEDSAPEVTPRSAVMSRMRE